MSSGVFCAHCTPPSQSGYAWALYCWMSRSALLDPYATAVDLNCGWYKAHYIAQCDAGKCFCVFCSQRGAAHCGYTTLPPWTRMRLQAVVWPCSGSGIESLTTSLAEPGFDDGSDPRRLPDQPLFAVSSTSQQGVCLRRPTRRAQTYHMDA